MQVFREVRRVLRPGGRWVFSVTHPIRWAFPDEPGPEGLSVAASYFDRTPYVEQDEQGRAVYVEHHRTLGDRVRDVVAGGFRLVDLVEPEWPAWNSQEWGGWSPLRGQPDPGHGDLRLRARLRPAWSLARTRLRDWGVIRDDVLDRLPVRSAVPALLRGARRHGCAVLCAPPGTGKTTLVPLALAGLWAAARCGGCVVAEPRRIAARAAARRMAWLLGRAGRRDGSASPCAASGGWGAGPWSRSSPPVCCSSGCSATRSWPGSTW